jgi:hypothetical protein
MVVAAERNRVVEAGAAARGPRMGMVDLAPGKGSSAAFGGAGLVRGGQGPSLQDGVQTSLTPDVERFGAAAQDGRDQSPVARQSPSLAG